MLKMPSPIGVPRPPVPSSPCPARPTGLIRGKSVLGTAAAPSGCAGRAGGCGARPAPRAMFFIPLWVGFSSAGCWAPFRSSCSFILHFKGSGGRRFQRHCHFEHAKRGAASPWDPCAHGGRRDVAGPGGGRAHGHRGPRARPAASHCPRFVTVTEGKATARVFLEPGLRLFPHFLILFLKK